MITTKFDVKKIIRLISIPLFIYLLSAALGALNFMRMDSFIKVDGQTIRASSYKNITLGQILENLGIELGKNDIVSKDLNKPLAVLNSAVITRVEKERKKINENVPFRMTWSRNYNSNLRKTQLQKGVEKSITKEVIDTLHDGIFFNREILSEKSVAKEYYRLALLTKDGKIEKIYDLTKVPSMKMVSTAYYPGDPLAWGDGTITFLGQKMQRGIVAVDPAVIPLKTRLFIAGYGYGYAGDTGNLIKGMRVDLGVNNESEEPAWSFRDVTVYILEASETY
jgi:3D (Asp-Asp-Asp) domain-containing protein